MRRHRWRDGTTSWCVQLHDAYRRPHNWHRYLLYAILDSLIRGVCGSFADAMGSRVPLISLGAVHMARVWHDVSEERWREGVFGGGVEKTQVFGDRHIRIQCHFAGIHRLRMHSKQLSSS